MAKRLRGLVVGKDFRPPDGAQPLNWCFLTIDLAERERVSVRLRREQISRIDIGDVVAFRRPRENHALSRISRLGSDPSLLPPVEGRRPNR